MKVTHKAAAPMVLAGLLLGSLFSMTQARAQGLPPVIKVGVSASLTGAGAINGLSAKTMIDMAAKEINAAGGIAGKPVQLFYADDEGDPTKAVGEAKRLIGSEKVNFVLGPAAAAPSLAAAPEYTRAKMLTFPFTGANIINPQNYPYGFGTFYSSDAFSDAMIDYAVDVLKARTVAALVDTGAQGRAAGEEFKIYAAKRGVSLLAVETHDYSAEDLSPQALNLRRLNPDVILHVATTGDSVGRIYVAAEQLNWHPRIVSQAAALFPVQIKRIAGENVFASGRIFGPTFKTTTTCRGENPANYPYVQYLARLKAFSPDASRVAVNLTPIYYDAIFLAKAAIEATKSVDGPTLAAWIEQNSSKASGIGGPFGASKTYHLIWNADAIAFTTRPDQPDANGLVARAGC